MANTMELRVLNTSFADIGVIDVFDSLIWKDRFTGYGDFEVAAASDTGIINDVNSGPYLKLAGSDHFMIVEDLNIKWEVETGGKVTVKGRSGETILERRIIWNKTLLTGNFQNGIQQLLNENAISPTDTTRTISRLEFEPSTDPIFVGDTALTVERIFLGETLYAAITALCLSKNVGYKITLTPEGKLRFKLYAGTDRSYGQTVNPYVVFSPNFDNLLNSDYNANGGFLKTVALVVGQGEGNEIVNKIVTTTGGPGTDLDRREMYVDGKSMEKLVPEGTISDTEYLTRNGTRGTVFVAQMEQIGQEELSKNVISQTFEGELDTASDTTYRYNRDFFIGDIVQTADNYGHEGKSQVTEVIHSEDINGTKLYPTFTTIA
jgi:hypothetical protein